MEQLVRDGRISTIYEGTTGIQALDLIGRKVMGSGGKLLSNFTKVIHKYCEANQENAELSCLIEPLRVLYHEWGELTMKIGEKAMENPDEVGAASVDFLMYSGYIAYAFMWLQMANVASQKIAEGSDDPIYKSKLNTAKFYFQRILPRTEMHRQAMLAGAETLMALGEEEFLYS